MKISNEKDKEFIDQLIKGTSLNFIKSFKKFSESYNTDLETLRYLYKNVCFNLIYLHLSTIKNEKEMREEFEKILEEFKEYVSNKYTTQ